jgi:anti-sigma-K factor RskA
MDERELEAGLRSVLRASEPRASATAKILQEVRRRERRASLWRWGSIAAALLLACALGAMYLAQAPRRDDPAALAAAAQLEEALRISSRKVAQLERHLIVHVNSGVDVGRAERN